ncbi:CvpA family protein [Paracoccaceae bacterium]|nr:CvpA family protein [Paracoccaceae bacterium]
MTDSLSSFDLISVILMGLSGFLAYFRGFIREVLLIINWFLAILVAYLICPMVFETIIRIEFIMQLLGDSCELMIILSFIIGFTVALIVISFFSLNLSRLIESSRFNEINKILGLLFGFLRGLLILIIFLTVYDQLLKDTGTWLFIEASKTNEITLNVQNRILTQYPQNIPDWIIGNYEKLLSNCVKK